MRKSIILAILCSTIATIGYGQFKPNLKNTPGAATVTPYQIEDFPLTNQIRTGIPLQRSLLGSSNRHQQPITFYKSTAEVSALKVTRSPKSELPIMIKGKLTAKNLPTNATPTEQSYVYLEIVKEIIQIKQPQVEFEVLKTKTDHSGKSHIKMQQYYQGLEVYGAEVILHTDEEGIVELFNGRYFPTPELDEIEPSITKTAAIAAAQQKLSEEVSIKTLSAQEKKLILGEAVTADLMIYHNKLNPATERLVWKVTLIPNITTRRTLFVDAHTAEILHEINHVCQFNGGEVCRHGASKTTTTSEVTKSANTNHHMTTSYSHLPPDGPAIAQADDLYGINRTINTYEKTGNFYLIDAVRNMSSPSQSNYPNEPVGAIWTIDAFNTAPQNDDFSYDHVVSGNNNWNHPTAVSAHYNAGKAYEYFEDVFFRNSINGEGGTIISLVNVAAENGASMGNAFWNGQAMFYGNGDNAFFPLARGLDVAGHEMAHGVVQATANLEYEGESGALNESMADVFGALIDRDDWKIGEDVVNTSVFPSGALRDLENPNNGGSSLSSPGWQPAHTSQQYMGSQDNGGVHINSGIPNRAFFLLATSIGKNKAEQIYYKALDEYLVRSSQFIDMRLAVINAAENIHGNNSSEAAAAASAFTNVGIGSGSGSNTQEDIDINPGTELVLLSDAGLSALYLADGAGNILNNPLQNTGIISKPSLPDDGSYAAYIADDKTMRYYDFIDEQEYMLNDQPIWRNVAVSKDGVRLAALTDDLSNQVFIYDLVSGTSASYELSNPTTAEGLSTGDVLYADALEWDYDNEYLMYDAINRIEGTIGTADIEYWDIGFVRVWNTATDNYGDGNVSKLFSGLPEDVSVGNPTFSKNSPYIIAFDYIDFFNQQYVLRAANIETGDIGDIFVNNVLSYPSYSAADGEILFDWEDGGQQKLAFKQLASNKITALNNGEPIPFIDGGKWGVIFSMGERDISSTTNFVEGEKLVAYPNPLVGNVLAVEMPDFKEANWQHVRLVDVLGQVILEEKVWVENATLQLNLGENLQKGVYALELVGQKSILIKRL